MGLLSFWKKRKRKNIPQEATDEEILPKIISRDALDVKNAKQREEYVRNCCEQMLEAGQEVERVKIEYQVVTDYLTDMEEIEALPKEQMTELVESAKKIQSLTAERKEFQGKTKSRMPNAQYNLIDGFYEQFPDCIKKMQKDEEYQNLVNQDLHYLEGEKGALAYRRYELKMVQLNSRGMAVIFTVAAIITFLMLFVLKSSFRMDTDIGYIVSATVTAIAITIVFVRYLNAQKEETVVERDLNRVILLQNRVKIKYVNITNLLEYNYSKFKVNSAHELNFLWEKYMEERAQRERYQKTSTDLEFYNQDLIRILRKHRIKDPHIWISQAEAIVDSREMVEIRHHLIGRRQKLRETMEYNMENMKTAETEVNSLIKEHPEYGREILAIVSEYD